MLNLQRVFFCFNIETSYRSSLVNQPYPHVLVYDTKPKSRSILHLPLELLIQKQLHSFRPGCVDLDGRYYVFSLARSASHSPKRTDCFLDITEAGYGAAHSSTGQDSQPCLVGLNLVPDSPKIRRIMFSCISDKPLQPGL